MIKYDNQFDKKFSNKNLQKLIFIIIHILPNLNSLTCQTGNKVTNSTECNKLNDKENLCCYLTPINNKTDTGMCYKYSRSDYIGQGSINYLQNTYVINCGLIILNDSPIESSQCNLKTEDNPSLCYKESIPNNSCCFYKYEGFSGCYWLGAYFKGTYEDLKMTLKCQSFYIKLNVNLLIIFFIIFIYT